MDLILMTGYSRGIGSAVAGKILESPSGEHARPALVLIGRRSVQSANFAGQLAPNDQLLEWDLSKPLSEPSRSLLLSMFRQPNVRRVSLIYAAGVLGPLGESTSRAELDSAWAVNVAGFVELAQMVSENSNGGFVFHLSSGAAMTPYSEMSSYCATKSACLMFARCLSKRWTANECAVLSIAPGTVMTDMTRSLSESDPVKLPGLDKFRNLAREGGFVEAGPVAEKIVSILLDENKKSLREKMHGALYDLRKPELFV